MRRLPASAALAILLAIGLVPALAPATVLAARPPLTLTSHATYDVLPAEGRIAVTVELTAANHLKDTATRRYFFRTTLLTVPAGSTNFRLSGGSGTPKVSVSSKTATYTNLRLDFGANLAAGKSMTLHLTFDLVDAGGAPDRALRVSESLVTFAAWAFATPETPGATVAVRLPTGYTVVIGRGPLTGPQPDGTGFERWSSGPLDAPLEFIADVAADRPADFVATTHTVNLAGGPAEIELQSWPDDTAWRDRIAGLVDGALPILERDIGLPWPVQGTLGIHEALVRGTGGYAGLFDPAQGRIEIAYAAPDIVVIHELAHAWFNGRLVADRWSAEAFASYYADLVATELGLDTELPLPAVLDPADPAAIPLNSWGVSGSQSAPTEAYAYAASAELARTIAGRAGADDLQAVWRAAAAGHGAYGGEAAGPPDWRALLDLLDETTGQDFDDLWSEWVARPDDLPVLADREAARDRFDAVVAKAGSWRLSSSITGAMSAWQFQSATQLLVDADGVLNQRGELETLAASESLRLPATLQAAFESPDGPGAAIPEAAQERAAVDAIVAARAARPSETGVGELLVTIGLLGQQPESRLAEAVSALADGRIDDAAVGARAANLAWSNAAAVGRSRIVSVALLLVALVLVAGIARNQRRRNRAAESVPAAEVERPGS